jgi:hypothetical protein
MRLENHEYKASQIEDLALVVLVPDAYHVISSSGYSGFHLVVHLDVVYFSGV